MNKDFGLILKMAKEEDAPMPTAGAAFPVNSSVMATNPEADFSVAMKYMVKGNGKKQATASKGRRRAQCAQKTLRGKRAARKINRRVRRLS